MSVRTLRRRARGAFGAAFSVGPGYEPQPLGTHVTYETVRGYLVDLRRKALARPNSRINARGIVSQPGPTLLAQQALGHFDRHLDGAPGAAVSCVAAAGALLSSAREEDGALVWQYEAPVTKYGLDPGWRSCMAQGQAASALLRAHLITGDDRYVDAAVSAANGIRGEIVTHHPDAGPVLQECPTTPPSHILNGWLFGLWGLWEVATVAADTRARSLFEASSGALARLAPEYDTGWWSRYSLFEPLAPDLAKPFYHRLHAVQLEATHRLTGLDVLGAVARRFASYDRVAHRARAVSLGGISVLRAEAANYAARRSSR